MFFEQLGLQLYYVFLQVHYFLIMILIHRLMVDAIVEKRQLLLDSYQQNHQVQLCLFYLNLFHLSLETLRTLSLIHISEPTRPY